MAERLTPAEYRAILAGPATAAAMLARPPAGQALGVKWLDFGTRLVVRAGLMTEAERGAYLELPVGERLASWATGDLAARAEKLRAGMQAAAGLVTDSVKSGLGAAAGAAQGLLNIGGDVWLMVKIVVGGLFVLLGLGVVFFVVRLFR